MDAIEKLQEYLRDTRAQRYPILGHPLANMDDYHKNYYYTMLCLVMQYEQDITRGQAMFLQRLIAGCGAEDLPDTYARRAMELDVSDFEEFFERLMDTNTLRSAFAVDAILAASLGRMTDGMTRFLAQVLEGLRITPGDAKILTQICRRILAQDRSSSGVDLTMFSGYFINTSGNKGEKARTATSRVSRFAATQKRIIKGENFNLAINRISFTGEKQGIEFISCSFTGGETPISFSDCGEVRFDNCSFSDFKTKVITLKDTMRVTINASTFQNCIELYSSSNGGDWNERGCVISGSPDVSLTLSNNLFQNCGGRNNQYYFVSSFITNCTVILSDCRFEKCWHRTQFIDHDPKNAKRVMFAHVQSADNCTVTHSAALGPTA